MEVLAIEDNPADRWWLEHILQALGIEFRLSWVTDGAHAVEFLLRRGTCTQVPTPDLIFLDVHLPLLDGIDILRQVPHASELPICVLTSSEKERPLFRDEFGILDSNYLLKPVSEASLQGSACFTLLWRNRQL